MTESVEQKLKHLMRKAWRERWTDLMWGIYVKEVIPAGTTGDTYNLAESILQQALIGPSPNSKLLSYLQHSLHVQIVSYSAVFENICLQGSIQKTRCLLELLLLVEQSIKHISCTGSGDGPAALAASLLSLETWLWSLTSDGLKKLFDNNSATNDYSVICHYTTGLLGTLYEENYLISLLYIARCCTNDQFSATHLTSLVNQTESNLKNLTTNGNPSSEKLVESIEKVMRQCRSFENDLFKENGPEKPFYENSLCTDVHTLISWEALLRPTSDGLELTRQLEVLQKLRGYSPTQLYCEILRACCLGLAETADSPGELRWAVFTFLKAPSLLLRLHRSIFGLDPNSPIGEPSPEVAGAFERLLCYPGLLETTDAKCHCNVVEGLLNEVKIRTSLLSEWHVTSILSKRESLSRGGLKLETTNTQIATLVLRAEPTVASILKTLDTDYAKNQDTLLKVLSHLLSGQSFELILNAATGTGKLRAFATKLVRFNEANRQPAGSDPSKTANARALLFDISFLMLCRITQMYGIEVILSGEQGGETFFEQWASEWLKPNQAPDLSLSRCDPMLTDQLLKALTSGESDLRSGSVRWHEACFHVPAVIREILGAYESQLVSDEEVERILDTLRTQMCCLSVCAAAWLRFYIQVQPANLKSKPTSMLDHLMTSLNLDDSKEHYRERSVLMLQIIRRLAQDDNPLQSVSENQDQSLDHQLTKLWNKILNHGWSDHSTTVGIDQLFKIGGATWLVTSLVKAVIKEQSSDKRQRCVEGALSVAHLDLESCAISLATRVLPFLLTHSSMLASDEETGGPGGKALAQLTVLLFTAALNNQLAPESDSTSPSKKLGSKRSIDWDLNTPGFRYPPLKKMALHEEEFDFMFVAPNSAHENNPLSNAIGNLMQLMTRAAGEGIITPQLAFISYFIQTMAEITSIKTKEVMRPLLTLIPPALVFYMLAVWPGLMSISDVAKLLAHPGDEMGVGKIAAQIVCAFKNIN
ncbi:mediator of RNA polymerase II transcription subunit 24-like [Daphnia pulicaria]|uniref:mediator of RNA polymerase II transcription subunit 24-like n=1 Tax=Daphnia pulicaria TaxID=35523 RepID=UPI001EEBE1E7|nr:mediator of RNA polymerase II transcription subunit 24-like [Daphnia pulicaria]